MTSRTESLSSIARRHLSLDDAHCVDRAFRAAPQRFRSYLSVAVGRRMSDMEIAGFMLQCAKRILAGPEA